MRLVLQRFLKPQILWPSGIALTYSILGFGLLPYWATRYVPRWLSTQTQHAINFEALHFNPFTTRLQIDGLAIADDRDTPLLKLETLIIDIDSLDSVWHQTLAFDQLKAIHPQLNIEHFRDGRFNFSGFLAQRNTTASSESTAFNPLPSLNIDELALVEGQLVWIETPQHGPQSETLLPVNFSVLDVNTRSASHSRFDLNFKPASGGMVHWQGHFNLAELSSNGHIELQDVAITKLWQMFLQDWLPINISRGTFDLNTDYIWQTGEQAPELRLDQGELRIQQLAVKQLGQTDSFLSLADLQVSALKLDSLAHVVDIGSIHSEAIQLRLNQDETGNWDLATLLPASSPSPSPSAPDRDHDAANWRLGIADIQANGNVLQAFGPKSKQPLFDLNHLNVHVTHLSNQNQPIHWELNGQLFEHGEISLTAQSTASTAHTQIDTRLSGFKLKPLQNWLTPYVNLELIDGELNLQGQLEVLHQETPQLLFAGDASLNNLITRDTIKHKDFLKWANLQLSTIRFDQVQQQLSLQNIVIEQPYLRVNIKNDGSSNFSELRHKPEASVAVTTKTESTTTPLAINIDKIQLQNGETDFSDNSLLLPFATHIKQLNGELNDFVSNQQQAATLKLQGRVFDLALVNITGQHTLKNADSDIKLSFTHMPLPLITPYMSEFSGYSIEKGQMALDLEYSIHQGQLEAHNKLFIDQLVLGEHVDNPRARSLPIKLAIALLKDSSGKINLDFPISGSLDDPRFNFETFIADAAGNLISKIATSPFKMFGNLLDSKTDYSAIKFAAGSAELDSEQQQKLIQLAQALQTKPELGIDIKAAAYQNQDWPVIRFESIIDILKKMKSGELRDRGQNIRSEYIELSEDEYRRLLAKFFKEVFPDDIEYSLLGKPRIKSQPDAEFYSLAKYRLELAMPPEGPRLNNLAIARANTIARYLIEAGQINRDRIFILATEVKAADTDEINALLSLNAGL